MHSELKSAILSPSYTPRVRDCEAVVDLVIRGLATPQAVTVALLRVGAPAIPRVAQVLASAPSSVRPDLVPILGRLLVETKASDLSPLLALLSDADRKVCRAAMIALGKLPEPSSQVEASLIQLWPKLREPADQRAVAESLGKIGGPSSLALLSPLMKPGDDSVLGSAIELAVQRLKRTTQRAASPTASSRILAQVALPEPWLVTLRMRAGLEALALQSMSRLGLTPQDVQRSRTLGEPSKISIRWSRPLGELFALRTFIDLAFELPLPSLDLADVRLWDQVALSLSRPATKRLMQTLTDGPLRYRLELFGAGPRRGLVKKLVQTVSAKVPHLLNDPTDSPWQIDLMLTDEQSTGLVLVPKQLPDPRFGYRRKMVAAASHPTLAAALAELLSPSERDVVWDPFVGSGAELCELALRSPKTRLIGSDLDEEALAATRENAQAAGARIELAQGDALSLWPSGVTCVVSNPPMGRRVCRGDLEPLLVRFVTHVARRLPSGGRLCWLNPLPNQTSHIAEQLGLRRKVAHPVDMNGFWAQLELWQKL
jgi:hypothetical protein